MICLVTNMHEMYTRRSSMFCRHFGWFHCCELVANEHEQYPLWLCLVNYHCLLSEVLMICGGQGGVRFYYLPGSRWLKTSQCSVVAGSFIFLHCSSQCGCSAWLTIQLQNSTTCYFTTKCSDCWISGFLDLLWILRTIWPHPFSFAELPVMWK